ISGVTESPSEVAFSPDSGYLAFSVYFGKGAFKLWNTHKDKWWEKLSFSSAGAKPGEETGWDFNLPDSWMEFSRDSRWLVFRNGHWNLNLCELGKEVNQPRCVELHGHKNSVDSHTFISGGRWLVTTERRQGGSQPLRALLWRLNPSAEVRTPK